MTDRQRVAAGWVLSAISMLTGILAVAFLLTPVRPGVEPAAVTPFQAIADGGFVVIAPLMGLLIVRAQPRSPVGWLFIAFPGLLVSGFLGDGLARHLAPSAGLNWTVSATNALSSAGFGALGLLLMYFPTGAPMSPRWRWVAALIGVGTLVQVASQALTPLRLQGVPDVVNPMSLNGWDGALVATAAASMLLMVGGMLAAVVHLVLRIRRARGVERQQLKWFALSGALIGTLLGLAVVSLPLGPLSDVLWTVAFTSLPLLPIAAAIAIVRHRLFDIDLIIKRSASYVALSLVLIGAYLAGALLLQLLLAPFTQQSELAVAGSTLVVAALFQPARRRIQTAVDRRFDRARYDAATVMADFSGRLRDGLDLENVRDEIVATIAQTMRPASVSVWLRPRETER